MSTQGQRNEANQALDPPIDELVLVETHIRLMSSIGIWSDVGILIDENHKATLILLLLGNTVVSILRLSLTVEESVLAIDALRPQGGAIYFGCWQGQELTREQIGSLQQIDTIWKNISDQTVEYALDEVKKFFEGMDKDSKGAGRGKDFSTDTKRRVMQASHGRCMFEGCGENLGFDDLTGTEGNFSYLAHNVASSESGPRGVKGLSGRLSDDPKNVLLLCDKHHRLVDKVAAADYSASRLSKMRREFCGTADQLLTGLSYQPIPVFSVLWPVHGQTISCPSSIQVAQCLSKMHARLDSRVIDVSDNESTLRDSSPDQLASNMPLAIERAADLINMQAHSARYKAALFAFGLMPPLIGLGAKIGNKNEIIPMLRYRDGGQWTWPSDHPKGRFYEITGIDHLSDNETSVVLILALTSEPKVMGDVAQDLEKREGVKTIKIRSLNEYMGNGALSHPEDGHIFSRDVQELLHTLVDKHGVKRLHLLPCASNVACVFFGKAYDSHHPDMVVYDFENKWMQPQLLITNNSNKCVVTAV